MGLCRNRWNQIKHYNSELRRNTTQSSFFATLCCKNTRLTCLGDLCSLIFFPKVKTATNFKHCHYIGFRLGSKIRNGIEDPIRINLNRTPLINMAPTAQANELVWMCVCLRVCSLCGFCCDSSMLCVGRYCRFTDQRFCMLRIVFVRINVVESSKSVDHLIRPPWKNLNVPVCTPIL